MKKRLSIGIFVDSFFPMVDGVIVVVDNYARRLVKDNDVTIICPRPLVKDYKFDKPYKVITCRTIKIPLIEYRHAKPLFDPKFRKKVNSLHFDIVHIHAPFNLGNMGTRYAKRHHVPLLATFHSQYKQDFYIRTKSRLFTAFMMHRIMKVFNRADLSFAVNERTRDLYHNEYGAKVKTLIKHNGTDLKYFSDQQRLAELKAKYGIKADEKVLLFVGRIDKVKNLYFTVDVLKILHEKGFKFRMLFVGSGPDQEGLEKKIAKSGFSDSVMFLGRIIERETIAMHYGIADLFVFPSLYDTNSLVQIEAASQKTPTIFIKDSVTSGTVTDGVNGYFAENDATDFANKIIAIFEEADKYREISENAHDQLYKTWDDVIKSTYDDYLQIIAEKTK